MLTHGNKSLQIARFEINSDENRIIGGIKQLKAAPEPPDAAASTPKRHRPVDPAILANFDFSTVPNDILAEIVIESLKLVTDAHLDTAIRVSP